MTNDDLELEGTELAVRVMQRWLPASRALLESIILHLPSPKLAQRYRAELFCAAAPDHPAGTALRACDAFRPALVYVARQIPATDGKHFIALGPPRRPQPQQSVPGVALC